MRAGTRRRGQTDVHRLVTAGRAVRQERFCRSHTIAEVHALLGALDQAPAAFEVTVERVPAHLAQGTV
ncbi:MAG: hypothetical protein LH645_05555 [Actinomycetia bacterium]|nr:hypothetical protein [Actinomycetes bacterium]